MEGLRAIVARFPQRELDIRRRCGLDVRFRAICADYEEATAAFRHWRSVGAPGDGKAEEYATFLSELEVEILDQLSRSNSSAVRS